MRKVIYYLTFAICIICMATVSALAQSKTIDSHIILEATGEVHVPADKLQFRVNITQFKQDAREAFELHKQQENFLTQLLLEEEIPDSNISANPINISHVRGRNNVEGGYETRQQVQILLDDVSQFESMQIKLIENGFIDFSGTFTSSRIHEASNMALEKAVKQAKMKAGILADAAGKEVTDIISINYTSGRNYTQRTVGMELAYDAGGGSLLQFERTIPVRENVTVTFQID